MNDKQRIKQMIALHNIQKAQREPSVPEALKVLDPDEHAAFNAAYERTHDTRAALLEVMVGRNREGVGA